MNLKFHKIKKPINIIINTLDLSKLRYEPDATYIITPLVQCDILMNYISSKKFRLTIGL
jgi:hypothetical protein